MGIRRHLFFCTAWSFLSSYLTFLTCSCCFIWSPLFKTHANDWYQLPPSSPMQASRCGAGRGRAAGSGSRLYALRVAGVSSQDVMGYVLWYAIYINLYLQKLPYRRNDCQTHDLSVPTINPKKCLSTNFHHFKGSEFQDKTNVLCDAHTSPRNVALRCWSNTDLMKTHSSDNWFYCLVT